jgi:PE-PPE domain
MSGRKLRWVGLGLVATAGAGVLGLSAMMNSASAHADDIGLVMGGSGLPIPGPLYVGAADGLYLNNPLTGLYPDLTFYQATPANPFGNGLFTPEGLYPLTGVHTLPLNYPLGANGLPELSTSVGQGATILESTILGNTAAGDSSTVFGYSQSSTLSGITMQMLEQAGVTENTAGAPQFLLIADPSAPNGGLLERFNGFETISGEKTVDPLNLPSVGISFDGATPADDFTTNIYSLEYDGFADFPRYPLNFLADLNAFLGIQTLHGTYLNGGVGGSGPTAEQIANAILLPGSEASGTADSLTNYHMILETAPLVTLLDGISKPLGDLLGPDLTTLINLGYGADNLGYSDAPANIPTPFALFPNVDPTTLSNELAAGAQSGFAAFEADMANPASFLPASSSVAEAVPAATPTLTEIVNALSSAASTAYSTLLPLQDISNFLSTSLPAYDISLFTDNLQTGDLTDALGLPLAANTALDTLAAGFATEIISSAASQIAADFSSIGL